MSVGGTLVSHPLVSEPLAGSTPESGGITTGSITGYAVVGGAAAYVLGRERMVVLPPENRIIVLWPE